MAWSVFIDPTTGYVPGYQAGVIRYREPIAYKTNRLYNVQLYNVLLLHIVTTTTMQYRHIPRQYTIKIHDHHIPTSPTPYRTNILPDYATPQQYIVHHNKNTRPPYQPVYHVVYGHILHTADTRSGSKNFSNNYLLYMYPQSTFYNIQY